MTTWIMPLEPPLHGWLRRHDAWERVLLTHCVHRGGVVYNRVRLGKDGREVEVGNHRLRFGRRPRSISPRAPR